MSVRIRRGDSGIARGRIISASTILTKQSMGIFIDTDLNQNYNKNKEGSIMKRIQPLILTIILMSLCCSCGLIGDQEYVCKVEDVAFVQIVSLDKYVNGEYRYEYTVLSQIDDFESFINRLNGVKHSVNWGDPRQMEEGYIAIRIEYQNGDFDLLHSDAQWFNRDGTNNSGYFFFDDEQFDALISDYMAE